MTLSGKTAVVGVIGDPVSHSLSPLMHNAAIRQLGIDWVYVPFHVRPEHLEAAVRSIPALGLKGFNVTVPHKVAVMQYLDEIELEAEMIGAVNTIVNRNGRLVGYNTDGRGFLRSLEREGGRTAKGADVLILGAGGAAKAIACATALAGANRVTIANRTREKAEALAALVQQRTGVPAFAVELPVASSDPASFGPGAGAETGKGTEAAPAGLTEALGRADIVVQTTSVGMYPHHDVPPIIDVGLLSPGALVCDIVYRPRETSLLKAARARGLKVLTGEGMLAYQGAIALELWTGLAAPEALMLETLLNALDAEEAKASGSRESAGAGRAPSAQTSSRDSATATARTRTGG